MALVPYKAFVAVLFASCEAFSMVPAQGLDSDNSNLR